MAKQGVSVDEQFLKELGNNPFYQDTKIQRNIASQLENSTDELEKEATKVSSLQVPPPPVKSSTERRNDAHVEKLQARAEKLSAANADRLAREAQQEQEEAQERLASRDTNIRTSLAQNVRDVQGGVANLADRVGSIQTVGGIGLLLAILLLLVFAIVQVNAQGDTRLKQFWYMLNGRATLQGSVSPTIPTGTSGGLGQTLGPTPPLNNGGINSTLNGSYRTITG